MLHLILLFLPLLLAPVFIWRFFRLRADDAEAPANRRPPFDVCLRYTMLLRVPLLCAGALLGLPGLMANRLALSQSLCDRGFLLLLSDRCRRCTPRGHGSLDDRVFGPRSSPAHRRGWRKWLARTRSCCGAFAMAVRSSASRRPHLGCSVPEPGLGGLGAGDHSKRRVTARRNALRSAGWLFRCRGGDGPRRAAAAEVLALPALR